MAEGLGKALVLSHSTGATLSHSSRSSCALHPDDGPNLKPLTERHHAALSLAWRIFDLVGLTERFDEFMLLFADLVGLQALTRTGCTRSSCIALATITYYAYRMNVVATMYRTCYRMQSHSLLPHNDRVLQAPAYRMQQVATETLAASKQQQARDTSRTCGCNTTEWKL